MSLRDDYDKITIYTGVDDMVLKSESKFSDHETKTAVLRESRTESKT